MSKVVEAVCVCACVSVCLSVCVDTHTHTTTLSLSLSLSHTHTHTTTHKHTHKHTHRASEEEKAFDLNLGGNKVKAPAVSKPPTGLLGGFQPPSAPAAKTFTPEERNVLNTQVS
jgi:hypothetical protein